MARQPVNPKLHDSAIALWRDVYTAAYERREPAPADEADAAVKAFFLAFQPDLVKRPVVTRDPADTSKSEPETT